MRQHSDKIPSEIIKARTRKMRQLSNLKRKSFYDRFIGKTLDVLVESTRDEATGMLKGFSSNYVPVMFEGGYELKNTIVKVGFTADCRKSRDS